MRNIGLTIIQVFLILVGLYFALIARTLFGYRNWCDSCGQFDPIRITTNLGLALIYVGFAVFLFVKRKNNEIPFWMLAFAVILLLSALPLFFLTS
jgi:hypothetical protein